MSLWDDFKRTITPFAQTLTGQGSINDISPINQPTNQILPQLTPLKAAGIAGEGTLGVIDAGYTYGVSRPLTTTLLGLDSGAQYPGKSEGTLSDIQARWNASRFVSPNQEIVAGFNNFIGEGATYGPFSGDDNDAETETAREQVNNAMLKRERLDRFTDNLPANVVSAAGDGSLRWFLDPIVVASKVFKVAREVPNLTGLARERAAIESRTGGAWEFIQWATVQKTPEVIAENKKGISPALANALAESDDVAESALIWLASRGDVQSIKALEATHASTVAALEAADTMLSFARLGGYPDGLATAKLESEIADLVLRDNQLAMALETKFSNVQITAARGQDLSVSLLKDAEKEAKLALKAERKVAARFGYSDTLVTQETASTTRSIYTKRVYQRGPGIRPTVVWMPRGVQRGRQAVESVFNTGRATGLFHLQGSNEADNGVELIGNLRTGALKDIYNGQEARAIYNTFMSAPNAQAKNDVLIEFEKDALTRLAGYHGVQTSRIPEVVEHIVSSKAKQSKMLLRDKGFWVDEYGTLNVNKAYADTQTPDSFIMMNWDETSRVLRNAGNNKNLDARSASDIVGSFFHGLQQIWRPAVLFRLGYTIRNVTEGWLRFASVSDAMQATNGIIGTSNRLANFSELGFTARALGRTNFDDITQRQIDKLDGVIAARLDLRGVDVNEFAAGRQAIVTNETLSDILSQQDRVLANQQAVIENVLIESRYRLGVAGNVYRGFDYEGTFAGQGGRFLRELSSSRGTQERSLTGVSGTSRGGSLASGEDGKKYTFGSDVVKVDPQDQSYVPSLVNTVNTQWRNSPMVSKLLEGQSVREVSAWLKTSDSDAFYVRNELNIGRHQVEEYVANADDIIRRYLPDPKLRSVAATRDLTVKEVETAMSDSGFVMVNASEIAQAKAFLSDPKRAAEITSVESRARNLGDRAERYRIHLEKEPARIAKAKIKRDKLAADIRGFDVTKEIIVDGKKVNPNFVLQQMKTKLNDMNQRIINREKYLASVPARMDKVNNVTLPRVLDRHASLIEKKNRSIAITARPTRAAEKDVILPNTGATIENPEMAQIAATQSGYEVGVTPEMYNIYRANGMKPPGSSDEWLATSMTDANGRPYELLRKGSEYQRWQPITGKELQEVIPPTGVKEFAKRQRDRVFRYIGSLPEDTVLRHPFVNMRYNQYMQQTFDNLIAQGITEINNVTLKGISRAARVYALREVKRTLYTIDRYNNASGNMLMQFIAPFYAAWENTGRTWARIASTDPTVLARGMQVINAPLKSGWIVDEDNQIVDYKPGMIPSRDWSIQVQLPEAVANKVPGLRGHPQFKVNLKSLNVVLQGENIFSPGFGPIVQLAVSEMVKLEDNAITRFLSDNVLTFGASKTRGSVDKLLPSSIRNLYAAFVGEDSPAFANDAIMMFQQNKVENERKGNFDHRDLLNKSIRDTHNFYLLKFFASEILPFAPRFDIKPEFQFAVDQYRLYSKQGTVDGVTPTERFRADYPDYFEWAIGTSDNVSGVYKTRSARANIESFQEAIDQVLSISGQDPSIIGALVNNPEDTKYDQITAAWLYNRRISPGREAVYTSGKSIQAAADQAYINQGWSEYIAMNNETKALLSDRGLNSFSAAGASDLLERRRAKVEELNGRFPEWAAVFGQPNPSKYRLAAQGFEMALSNSKFANAKKNDPAWQAITVYLAERRAISNDLNYRKANGGSGTINVKGNEDILSHYLTVVNDMNNKSPRAFEIYSRYLDGEFGKYDDIIDDEGWTGQ
jgi:hypothetical protein